MAFHTLQLIWEVFRRYDDDMDSSLSMVELSAALYDGRNETLNDTVFATYKGKYDTRHDGLSRDGFVQLVTEAKESGIRSMLK